MKIFSGGKQLNAASARNCLLVNQLATPGLGSLMGGRFIEGLGQLALAFLGAGLVLFWVFKTMQQEFDLPDIETPLSYNKWGWAGTCFFIASWLWSLLTSLSLIRQAKNQPPLNPPAASPPIINPPPKI